MFDDASSTSDESGISPSRTLESYTSYLLWRVTRHAEEQIADVLAPFRLRLLHLCVLRMLATGSQTQTALAKPIRANRMMITRLVNDIEEAGLVHRTPISRNRRAYNVTLTPQGTSVLAQTDTLVGVVEASILAPFSIDEQTQFRAMLLFLIEAYSRMEPAANRREEGL
ncbi:MAG: MarR family transcriptional regulator [Chloroflexota bacterium]|nr:MarR family transcriptional regulator [Chloroflexota bacterium]